jgi:transcriptional regulator with XRE-family HTH domain
MKPALAEFVRRTRHEKKLSTKDVETNSDGEISDSYVSRIESGIVANVSPGKLNALAKGLQIPADTLYRVARGLPAERPKERMEILAEAYDGQDLSESDWAEIEAVIKTMIDSKKAKK